MLSAILVTNSASSPAPPLATMNKKKLKGKALEIHYRISMPSSFTVATMAAMLHLPFPSKPYEVVSVWKQVVGFTPPSYIWWQKIQVLQKIH
ncbi:hypothetical protein ACFX2B_008919 [Malus domestica]